MNHFNKIFELFSNRADLQDESIDYDPWNTSSSNDFNPNSHLRFGTSPEIQECESVLQHERGLVDFYHRTVNYEQAECDSTQGAINTSFDKDRISALELELQSHQRKLSQARADLTTHQRAEYAAQDRLNQLRSSAHTD